MIPNRSRPFPFASLVALIGLFFPVAVISAGAAEPHDADIKKLTSAELFKTTNLWTIHLKFDPAQWKAMEPKDGPGVDGPGGQGNRTMFGPAMFVAPAFLKDGDKDGDNKLSRAEFQALSDNWFDQWDKEKTGRVDAEQLRTGLNTTIPFPGMPRGPGGGPGRPGGGGGGFTMNLQGDEGKRNGLASSMGIDFSYVHADMEFQGTEFKDVAVRYKGNGTFMQSRDSAKRSLKVTLDKYQKGQALSGVTTLNLHNSVTDASWMNEVLSHQQFRAAGVPAPRTAYARVYVTVPGQLDRQYLGLYSLVEDVDKAFAHDRFGTRKGAIFKPVTPTLFSDLGDDWKKYKQTYDPKTPITPEQQRRVIDFAKLVTHATDAEFASKLDSYLDMDEFARFLAVEVWLCSLDSILTIGQNYYVYLHPKSNRFQFIPWDLDHAFGQFGIRGSQEEREQLSIRHPWDGDNRFLERVMNVPAFRTLYLAKLEQFNRTIFQPVTIVAQVDQIAAAIRPAVAAEAPEKLARFDKVVAGESVEPVGFGRAFEGPRGGPGGGDAPRFGPPPGFMKPVKPIKTFVKARAQSVADQLSGNSEGKVLSPFGAFGNAGPGGPPGGVRPGPGGGFGGPGGPGGGPGGPGGGPGGPPPGFGPGTFLGGAFMKALDADKDGILTREECRNGFAKWFDAWNTDKSGAVTQDQLRTGINQDLTAFPGGPPNMSRLPQN